MKFKKLTGTRAHEARVPFSHVSPHLKPSFTPFTHNRAQNTHSANLSISLSPSHSASQSHYHSTQIDEFSLSISRSASFSELYLSKLEPLLKDHYLLFDFPGQVELFFIHSNAKTVIMKLIKKLNLRLTAVHLVDAHLCSDPGKYVSALLLTLSTMLHLELPHINVLSKIDLIENYGKLAFNLDFYTDVEDLSYLQHHLDQDPRSAKYRKLTKELCDVIEDFSLVNFSTLDIQDKESVGNLVKLIDKTNGYIFSGIEASAVEFSKIAVGPLDWDYYRYPCLLLILNIIFAQF
ncbi:hypothetical protein RGQ29_032640 [Quercus rubra]|uniref:GPN-loop GTPase 2 n=1 Tax=Quercus rubra TaxID=3512 RepID=A0AAN7DUY4_QUERU|nr:hypothetical protein RGQ29_032640 [Quercus rubra]